MLIFGVTEKVNIFVDEMVIWAQTEEELLKIMNLVFERARKYGVKFNANK